MSSPATPRATVRITTPVQRRLRAPCCTRWSTRRAPRSPGPRVAVIGRIHGNEPVGDGVLARLHAEVHERLVAGSLLTIRGNEQAATDDARHTAEGSDLNRMWDPVTLARIHAIPAAERSYEQSRAVALAPLLLAGRRDPRPALHEPSGGAVPHRSATTSATVASRCGSACVAS